MILKTCVSTIILTFLSLQMKKTKKPFWLILLTMLSLCGGLIGIIVYLTAIISFESLSIFNFIPGFTSVKSTVSDTHFIFPYLKTTLLICSMLGAFWMFKMQKKGFVLYSTAQLLMLVIAFVLSKNKILVTLIDETPNIIFTIAFIVAYSFFIRDFKVASKNTEPETIEE